MKATVAPVASQPAIGSTLSGVIASPPAGTVAAPPELAAAPPCCCLAVEDDIENRKTHHDDEEDHEHDDFDSFVIELPAIASPEELARKVASAAEAENVLRLKGFAHVEGKPMRLLVQAVGPRVSHHYDRAWEAGEEKATRLVVIGLKGLDRAAVERLLAA